MYVRVSRVAKKEKIFYTKLEDYKNDKESNNNNKKQQKQLILLMSTIHVINSDTDKLI